MYMAVYVFKCIDMYVCKYPASAILGNLPSTALPHIVQVAHIAHPPPHSGQVAYYWGGGRGGAAEGRVNGVGKKKHGPGVEK